MRKCALALIEVQPFVDGRGDWDGPDTLGLSFVNPLKEASNQRPVEPVSTRLHLYENRANEVDMP
jgi:hypothetical protein